MLEVNWEKDVQLDCILGQLKWPSRANLPSDRQKVGRLADRQTDSGKEIVFVCVCLRVQAAE